MSRIIIRVLKSEKLNLEIGLNIKKIAYWKLY